MLDKLNHSKEIVFVANNAYYRGPPDIQTLIFEQYEVWEDQMEAFVNGDIHVVFSVNPVTVCRWKHLARCQKATGLLYPNIFHTQPAPDR